MVKGTTRKSAKQQQKHPQPQNEDPVAPARSSRSTTAQVQPLPTPVPAAQIFPTPGQLQAPLNPRSQSPGEIFDPISSDSGSDSGDQPATPTRAGTRPQIPVLVSPIKARQRRAADNIKKMSDEEVWDMTDHEIIGMFTSNKLLLNL